ncbi:hypothetical protein FRUB_03600 [Fimbriiglobus ruber]|uniref:Uncharacterized protein n=1 Tax=Fimbriiglobus ruber TaxID=1908690 RepID=A0A225DRS1_9BACT|nr:hypothetical protein FRUB_03600 [Fimbriiglobus ruber]
MGQLAATTSAEQQDVWRPAVLVPLAKKRDVRPLPCEQTPP